jgi:hypothetical protein
MPLGAVYISIGEVKLRRASQIEMGATTAWCQHYKNTYKRKALTKSMSIAAPGLSADISSPHKLPLTLAVGVRVLIVIGSCVDGGKGNGMLSVSS